MNERNLRLKVARRRKELRRSTDNDVPDQTWEYLLDMGIVGDADAWEDPVEHLVQHIDKLAAAAPDSSTRFAARSSSREQKDLEPVLGKHEEERAEIFSMALAQMVSQDRPVLWFRDRIMGGSLLTPERAEAFFKSPAAAHISVDRFEENQVSPVHHTATALLVDAGHEPEGPYYVSEICVEPPGLTHRVKIRMYSEAYKELFLAHRNSKHNTVARAHPFSPLGLLHDLSGALAARYAWEENEATRFVLTGLTPRVRPLTAQHAIHGDSEGDEFSYAFITLKVVPWLSGQAVKDAYISVQRDSILGHQSRRLSDKNLKLLRFVVERTDPTGPKPKGKELVKEWDLENPQWAYGTDTRTFWRDYNRARNAVISPDYGRRE